MRVLIIADIHSNFDELERILNSNDLNTDYGLIAGDMTHFHARDLMRLNALFNDYGIDVLAVHGNCDPPEIENLIEMTEIEFIHGRSVKFGKYTLHGVGGSNYTPFSTPSEYSENQIKEFVSRFELGDRNVLLTHCPPRGILDMTKYNVRAGCSVIRDIMRNFEVVFCGHIHEARGEWSGEKTHVVNPGPAFAGYFAIWDTDEFMSESMSKFRIELKRC
jgi:hypothetical protein